MLTETVSDLMTPVPIVVPVTAGLARCSRLMERHSIHQLVVVDADGKLVGTLSDFAVASQGRFVDGTWAPAPGSEVLSAGDLTLLASVVVKPDEAVASVLTRLGQDMQRVVVVVDDDERPVGVLSEQDCVVVASSVLPLAVKVGHEGTHELRTIGAAEPAMDALEAMIANRFRHLVVVDEAGKLAGVLSLQDLLSDAVWEAHPLVSAVMRPGWLHEVRPERSLRDAAGILARHRIGCLPVIDDDRVPLAIVTRTDVIAALVAALEQEALFP